MKFLGCRGGGENSHSFSGGNISLGHVGTTCHITRHHTTEDPGCKSSGDITAEKTGTTGAKIKLETNNQIQ